MTKIVSLRYYRNKYNNNINFLILFLVIFIYLNFNFGLKHNVIIFSRRKTICLKATNDNDNNNNNMKISAPYCDALENVKSQIKHKFFFPGLNYDCYLLLLIVLFI